MQARSKAETVSEADGVVQLAFDLSETDAGYLIISRPLDGSQADEFFGADHYVEVKDQAFGQYGGLTGVSVDNPRQFTVRLKTAPAGISELAIVTSVDLSPTMLAELKRLERC